jgi:hypothetical protein
MLIIEVDKDTAEIETGMGEKSSPGTRQIDGKNLVWLGEIERKSTKLSMPTFTYPVLPLNYFMDLSLLCLSWNCEKRSLLALMEKLNRTEILVNESSPPLPCPVRSSYLVCKQ